MRETDKSFNGFFWNSNFNGQKIFEIIPLEVGFCWFLCIEIKKSLIIVFSDGFEIFKCPGGQ
jgi:hypothetical protein